MYDEDDEKPRLRRDKDGYLRPDNMRFEFDCPECSANNPWDDGFRDQDEVQCHYCSESFRVTIGERGRMKFKSV